MNAPALIDPRRQAELWAIRRTEWSAGEYLELAHRYADTAHRMRIAIENEDFAGLQLVCAEFLKISDQTAFLTDGLQRAVEQVAKRDQEYMR